MAGCPVTLKTGVHGMKEKASFAAWPRRPAPFTSFPEPKSPSSVRILRSAEDGPIAPIAGGGEERVGVRRRS